MKKILPSLFAATLLLTLGCSTPDSRIHSQQAAFDAWPADVQQKVRAGHIDLGFTPPMVQMALGNADRSYTRTTDQGTTEVWVYNDKSPKFSIGVGVGGASGSTAVGAGVRVGDDGFQDNENLRVIFAAGKVSAIEARRK